MNNVIGIRRESKYPTEHRAPLTPAQVNDLIRKYEINVLVEPSDKRFFKDKEYEKAGAFITKELSDCNIIFGIKEIPIDDLLPNKPYCFFSHTVKGQLYNMRMLKRILEIRGTLIDYELVKDEQGKRLIFFGNYAGYAGMINSLWAFGQRLFWEGINNPFKEIAQAKEYESLDAAREVVKRVGDNIRQIGLPQKLVPLVCGFSGYGQVSRGAQGILDLLPVQKVSAKEFQKFMESGNFSNKTIYKIVFTKPDMYQNKSSEFNLQEFKDHPEIYSARLEKFIPYLSMFINGIFWQPNTPRLLTKSFFKSLYQSDKQPKLRVIGDITCDVNGSVEITVKATNSKNPVYVYEPLTEQVIDGWKGNGPVIMAVDKLPSEIPLEASQDFGKSLMPFVPQLAKIDYSLSLKELQLPSQFKKAVVAHRGELGPRYEYLKSILNSVD